VGPKPRPGTGIPNIHKVLPLSGVRERKSIENSLQWIQLALDFRVSAPKSSIIYPADPNMVYKYSSVYSIFNSENELLLILYSYIRTLPSWHDPLQAHMLDEEIIRPFFILGNKVTGIGN
jgi:hypothetical protein